MKYTKLGNSDLKTARRILVTLVMSYLHSGRGRITFR